MKYVLSKIVQAEGFACTGLFLLISKKEQNTITEKIQMTGMYNANITNSLVKGF